MADSQSRANRGTACVFVLAFCVLMQFGWEGLFAQEKPPQVQAPTSAPILPSPSTLVPPREFVPMPPGSAAQPGAPAPTPVPLAPPMVISGTLSAPMAQRFHFKIDPNTPLSDLLPVPPRASRPVGPVQTEDLAQVPEVRFQEPWAKDLPKGKALEQTALTIAKINHLNGKKTDGFLKALLNDRRDLAGLSFAMGDACRTTGERSRQFNIAVGTVRRVLQQTHGRTLAVTSFAPVDQPRIVQQALDMPPLPANSAAPTIIPATPPPPAPQAAPPTPPASTSPGSQPSSTSTQSIGGGANTFSVEVAPGTAPTRVQVVNETGRGDIAEAFWEQYRETCAQEDAVAERRDRAHRETVARARVAALMQIVAPEGPGMRLGLVRHLAGVPNVEATQALAKLALFSVEEEVRNAAVDSLQVRRERDYTEVLLAGFQYPLPAVARRAAEAVIKLERKDLLPQLVALLDEPDPRAPAIQEVSGKNVPIVRELVRVNHHRSCLLCHAPGNTPTVSPESLTAGVPIPGEPLPSPSQGYNNPSVPDILVRVDMTYLRQDFSILLPVADAHPWPEMQRFDFLVRSRALTEKEATSYREKLTSKDPGFVPPHRRAALTALRELTGRDTEPTSQAWRKLLSQAAPPPNADGAE